MRLPDALRALRHRNYRVYFWGQLVSVVGTWMQIMAQSWLVYRLTGSAWMLGLIGFVSQIPSLFLGVLGGTAADHFSRRGVLLWTQALALVQALALGALTLTGSVTVREVFALSVVLGLVNVFDMPARQALIVELVGREDLSNGIAVNTFMINASRLVGPAIAGLIVAAGGPRGEAAVFLLNAASYVASLVTLAMLRLPAPPPRATPTAAEAWAQVVDGVRYTFADERMRGLLLLCCAMSFFGMPYGALMPLFATRLGHGADGVGWLMAASGVGAIAASLALAARVSLDGLPRAVAAAAAVFGVALGVFAFSSSMALSLAAMTLAGWGMMTAFVGCNTLLQALTSDSMRGRVMALFSMTFMGFAPLGQVLFGWLADRFGAPGAVALGAAFCVAAAALFLRRRQALPRLETAAAAAALLLLLAAAPGRAVDFDETILAPAPDVAKAQQTLTWHDCVALALRRSPELLSALDAEQATRATYLQSFNGFLPTLVLQNGYGSSSFVHGVPGYTAQGTASLSLLNVGTIANVRSTKASAAQSRESARAVSSGVRFSLRQSFAQELFAQASLDVQRLIAGLRRRNAQLVSLRYDSGHEYKGNMMNAKAQLLQAQAGVSQALRQVRESRRSLDRELGVDEFTELAATGTLSADAPPDLPARMDVFLAGRPDVSVQQAAVDSSKAALLSAKSTLFPSLSASYTRSRAAAFEFPGTNYGWTASALLSYPLFGGGPTSTYYGVKAATRNLDKSQQDLRGVRDAAVLDLENNWRQYADAVDQVKVQEALLASSRQRNDEADVRYASGLLTFDNWNIIVSERVGSEQQTIQARLNAVVAQAAWEKSVGKELGE